MTEVQQSKYDLIRDGGTGYCESKRGLIAVWGGEAVRFLDGLITNDMKTLEDGAQMLAAFPNAQGRLLAVVRVLRQGDRFLFETEDATHEKLYQNLFRFTFAGDFFVEDLTEQYRFLEMIGSSESLPSGGGNVFAILDGRGRSRTIVIANDNWSAAVKEIKSGGAVEIADELFETLRIETGIPRYGVDMDETTIIPELGIDGMISYNKGCYIGQEIIARIHFRGHVAKRLTGLVMSGPGAVATGFKSGVEVTTPDGKNAGRITSVVYSPKLEKYVALAYVRYDYLADGTDLVAGDAHATVTGLPFIA